MDDNFCSDCDQSNDVATESCFELRHILYSPTRRLPVILARFFALDELDDNDPAVDHVLAQIRQKRYPLVFVPRNSSRSLVEASHKRSNDVEALAKIRKWNSRFNTMFDPLDTKEFDQVVEDWPSVDIQSLNLMAKMSTDHQEKTAAAAKVEELAPGRQAIEFM